MSKLLVINSSPMTDNSNTRELVENFVNAWKIKHGESEVSVVQRDIGRTPPPHLDEVTIGSFYTPEDARNDAQNQAISLSDQLVDELEQADAVVIGSPMHNFSITSSLKTYIDHVARVGRTFNYTDNGPVGLLKDKQAFIISARGGRYGDGSPAAAMNHQDTYLKTVLGFIGIEDVTTINAEGVSSGDQGVQTAAAEIDTLLA
ncbi:MAG: FMN-dependent NADH-azoreductase [Motiliproteus sp.]|nr:FMN-dependent NADH-azoreductase [Motiliproteus sp.]MCW9051408.1 FMN-dependent NADH-azoreductase [Motiliproteus sp.]